MGTRVVRYDGCECCEGGGGTVETECCPDDPLPETMYATLTIGSLEWVDIEITHSYSGGIHTWEGTVACSDFLTLYFRVSCSDSLGYFTWSFFFNGQSPDASVGYTWVGAGNGDAGSTLGWQSQVPGTYNQYSEDNGPLDTVTCDPFYVEDDDTAVNTPSWAPFDAPPIDEACGLSHDVVSGATITVVVVT